MNIERSTTRWKNPTDQVIKLAIFIEFQTKFNGDGRAVGRISDPFYRVEIPPDGERDIDSEYDGAIHKLDANGIVIGGLAPQLINLSKMSPVHPSLLAHDNYCAATRKFDADCNCSLSKRSVKDKK